jgi:hypothetical protein
VTSTSRLAAIELELDLMIDIYQGWIYARLRVYVWPGGAKLDHECESFFSEEVPWPASADIDELKPNSRGAATGTRLALKSNVSRLSERNQMQYPNPALGACAKLSSQVGLMTDKSRPHIQSRAAHVGATQ